MTNSINVDMPADVKHLRVTLPGEIGYVDVTTGLIDRDTREPVIVIEVLPTNCVTSTKHIYEVENDWRNGRVRMIGRPSAQLLEQRRQVEWFERVIEMHDSGDHTECPKTCPVKAADVPRETTEEQP